MKLYEHNLYVPKCLTIKLTVLYPIDIWMLDCRVQLMISKNQQKKLHSTVQHQKQSHRLSYLNPLKSELSFPENLLHILQ